MGIDEDDLHRSLDGVTTNDTAAALSISRAHDPIKSLKHHIKANPSSYILKRYPEPMAHGLEACEPSHPLWPMARRPVSRHTRAEAVDTGCQRDIPVL